MKIRFFPLRIIVKKIMANGKMYATFMNLEKAYDRKDRKELWDVLRVTTVGRKLLMEESKGIH